jgi:hypothetical protein
MTAAGLRQLQDDWDRAAWLERLAIGELTEQQQVPDTTTGGTDDAA